MKVKDLKYYLKKYPRDYYVSILLGTPSWIYDIKKEDDVDTVYDLHCLPSYDYNYDLQNNIREYYDTVGKLYDKLLECDEDNLLMMNEEGLGSSLSEVSDKVTNEEGELIINTVFIIPLIHLVG